MSNADTPLESILIQAIENTEGDSVSLGKLLDLYDDRSFGPIFTLLGLLVIIPPISTIPTLPTATAIVLLLFSFQMILGFDHIWLPRRLRDAAISKEKLRYAHRKSKSTLQFIDRRVSDRIGWVTDGPARYFAAILVCMLALCMPPLEFVPFAVTLPGTAIVLIGLALVARDGVLMLSAFAIASGAIFAVLKYSPLLKWVGLT